MRLLDSAASRGTLTSHLGHKHCLGALSPVDLQAVCLVQAMLLDSDDTIQNYSDVFGIHIMQCRYGTRVITEVQKRPG